MLTVSALADNVAEAGAVAGWLVGITLIASDRARLAVLGAAGRARARLRSLACPRRLRLKGRVLLAATGAAVTWL